MIAFVTCPETPELWTDDQLVLPHLEGRVEWRAHSWDAPGVDWPAFEMVVLRSCWDYHKRLPEFLAWLRARAADGTRLQNPAATVEWNLDKTYLQTLENQGVELPETVWLRPGDDADLAKIMSEKGWPKAVVKPAISLGAHNTWVISPATAAADSARAAELLADGEKLMVQRFLPEIVAEGGGEWSLVFFQNRFSHALVKRPKAGDFRVQHVHGGSMHPAQAPDWMVEIGEKILSRLPETPLYARVDGVLSSDGASQRFLLMELELIEPVLYLAQGGEAAARLWADTIAAAARPEPPAT